jgi:hypothetical protein
MSAGKIILLGVMCAALALGACISMGTPLVFDESVPPEESVNIYFYYGIEITSYNGIAVPSKKNSLTAAVQSEWRNVILPAGEIEFTLDIAATYGNSTYSARNVTFVYNFEPAGDLMYIMEFDPYGGVNKDQWRMAIYKQSPKEKLYPLKKENVIEYLPFQRTGRSILE